MFVFIIGSINGIFAQIRLSKLSQNKNFRLKTVNSLPFDKNKAQQFKRGFSQNDPDFQEKIYSFQKVWFSL